MPLNIYIYPLYRYESCKLFQVSAQIMPVVFVGLLLLGLFVPPVFYASVVRSRWFPLFYKTFVL